ncbi:MAG: hypothetical protein Q9176_003894 [Flavoplaca citrina]
MSTSTAPTDTDSPSNPVPTDLPFPTPPDTNPKAPPRPPLDVSNRFPTIADWKTAQVAICDLQKLCHHQAERAQELARSYQGHEIQETSFTSQHQDGQKSKEPVSSSPDQDPKNPLPTFPSQETQGTAFKPSLSFPKEHLEAYSAETRALGDLWEEHWEEEMHKRRMALIAERARKEGRGSEQQLADEGFLRSLPY